jgi:hypothetical protein
VTQEVQPFSEASALLIIIVKQWLLRTWLGTDCTMSIAGYSGDFIIKIDSKENISE